MAVINTSGTFANNEQVTSTKLNDLIDQAYFVDNAVTGTTLVVASGQLKVGTITATEMGTDSVTSPAILNGAVTVAKLSTGAPTWTSGGNVTVLGSTTALSSVTASTASVSIGSARTASGASNIDFNSTFPLTSYEARISRESGANGNLVVTNTGTGSVVITNAGTNSVVIGSTPIPTPSGTAPLYGARAFANFNCNGVTGTNNAVIRSSSNISSITRVSAGKYTVNFTVAMPSANYALIGTSNDNTTGAASDTGAISVYAQTASSASILISDANSAVLYDPLWCSIVVFA